MIARGIHALWRTLDRLGLADSDYWLAIGAGATLALWTWGWKVLTQ